MRWFAWSALRKTRYGDEIGGNGDIKVPCSNAFFCTNTAVSKSRLSMRKELGSPNQFCYLLYLQLYSFCSSSKNQAATPTTKMHFSILTASLALLATTTLSAPLEARTPKIVLSFAGATPEAFYTEIPPTDGTLFTISRSPVSLSPAIPLRHLSFQVSC